MRRAIPIALTLALAATGIAGAARAAPRTYTTRQVKSAFHARTGIPLVRFEPASTRDVTSLRTLPHRTARFGDFQLFVFRPAAIARMRKAFTNGVKPDGRHIYWVPDQAGGQIALTLHGGNLALGWFPPNGAHIVDARWQRLQTAMRRL